MIMERYNYNYKSDYDCGYEQYVIIEEDSSNINNLKFNNIKADSNYNLDVDSDKYLYMNESSFNDLLEEEGKQIKRSRITCIGIIWNITVITCKIYITSKIVEHFFKK